MKLIKYFFIVILSSAAIVGIASWVIKKGLRKSNVDFFGKMNAAGDTMKDVNIILVGSSRTLVHLNPEIIDSITGLNSYNYGLNAVTIRTCYNIIHYALKKQQHAKLVVLNIDYSMFGLKADPYKDPYYYPFEKDDDSLIMGYPGSKEWVHKLEIFDIAMYDDLTKYASIDGFIRPNRIPAGGYKGFYPHTQLNDFKDPPPAEILHSNALFSEEGLEVLQSLISVCRQKNVQLLMILAPYAKKHFPAKYIDNFSIIMNKVDSVAKKNNVAFINYTGILIAVDSTYFYNVNHLNIRGANIFSSIVADSIKKCLNVNTKH